MLKKLAVTLIALTAAPLALATGAPYVGASVGVNDYTSSTSNFRGMPLTVNAGYGATLNQNFYLGGEVVGMLGTATLNNNANNGVNLKTTYGYGLSLLPGVVLSEHTILFARAGLVKTRFTSVGDTASGPEFGLGLQTNLTQNLDLRGEYDYVNYNRFAGISAKADTFKLGIVYKFE